MKNINEALDYEIKSHWLASYISFGWGQEIIAWWIANKVKRKWKRYLWAENTRMKIINQNKDEKYNNNISNSGNNSNNCITCYYNNRL